jgi:uncharacterized protein DUF3667
MITETRPAPPAAAEAGSPAPAAEARCLNCGAELAGAYCSRCGQAAGVERLRFPRLARELAHGLLSLDVAVLRTLRALAARPGTFIREYLLGRRVGYAGPLAYYALVVAVNIAAAALLRDVGLASADRDPDQGFWERNFVALQISLAFALLLLPLAIAQRLVHRRAGWSVAEHYAFLLYVLAQSIVGALALTLLLLPFGVELAGDSEGLVWLGVFAACLVWAMRGFFAEPLWKSILKLLGALGLVSLGVLVVGVVVQLVALVL